VTAPSANGRRRKRTLGSAPGQAVVAIKSERELSRVRGPMRSRHRIVTRVEGSFPRGHLDEMILGAASCRRGSIDGIFANTVATPYLSLQGVAFVWRHPPRQPSESTMNGTVVPSRVTGLWCAPPLVTLQIGSVALKRAAEAAAINRGEAEGDNRRNIWQRLGVRWGMGACGVCASLSFASSCARQIIRSIRRTA
jgi:hypothetical protein